MHDRRPRGLTPTLRLLVLAVAALAVAGAGRSQAPIYESSVVGTEFDVIRTTDPTQFGCLESTGRGVRETPDKTSDAPLRQDAFTFVAEFEDGTRVSLAVDVEFETEQAARSEALRYVSRLGRLPTALRRGVERLVVHRGNPDATAFSDRGLIVVYSDNATKRISTHDLEETLFHESVHATWDAGYADSAEWRAAQRADGQFITEYAQAHPSGEDLAESALFAFALVHHPGRIPEVEADRIREAIGARIAFIETLLPRDNPLVFRVGPHTPTDGCVAAGPDLEPSVPDDQVGRFEGPYRRGNREIY